MNLPQQSMDSFKTLSSLKTGFGTVKIYRLDRLSEQGLADVSKLPFTIKVLLESILRSENGSEVAREDIENLVHYNLKNPAKTVVPFKPARVLMQDFTGVPALVDLVSMRNAMTRNGHDPKRINPLLPVDLIIDHSVQVDSFNSHESLAINAAMEFERNRERYEFLHWGQKAFQNLRVVPPANGICHQVNLEYLGQVVQRLTLNGSTYAFCDSVLGTDSHTPMINGIGVLAWGVGGIEAEAVMLGQPMYMLAPEVIGFRLTGSLPPGSNATDLVLTITRMLRKKGVVDKFVEFFGSGLSTLSGPDRATISNMSPECGATCCFFPVDAETLKYLRSTGRTDEQIELVETYCRAQGLFRSESTPVPEFSEMMELDLSTVTQCLAGPKRPQDFIDIRDAQRQWRQDLRAPIEKGGFGVTGEAIMAKSRLVYPDGKVGELKHGDVAIAAITSCTNTSNPWVMIGAGVLAKKAVERGLRSKPYVKTSLAPGSKVVTDYLDQTGLTPYLEQLGFYTVGYGCTTCIGNSGPLPDYMVEAVEKGNLVVASVLSGNRNFDGRINPHTKASYLMSPPLVVAYAIAGSLDFDFFNTQLGRDANGKDVYLGDIWPTPAEITALIGEAQKAEHYVKAYRNIESMNETWNQIPFSAEEVYQWQENNFYIKDPPFFHEMAPRAKPIASIEQARVLLMVGDSLTTDHISPAGSIAKNSPAGRYLMSKGYQPKDFNSYGSRRGNFEVMVRGTFANIRIRNQLAPGTEGGWTKFFPTGEVTSIYEAAMKYKAAGIPTLVLAGQDYGMGSSRDWAAKGPYLLGVKVVLAESFERIHRSNLVGMGILPLQYLHKQNAKSLGLTGEETLTIRLDDRLKPSQEIRIELIEPNGAKRDFAVLCRIDLPTELEYYRHGGILHRALRRFMSEG